MNTRCMSILILVSLVISLPVGASVSGSVVGWGSQVVGVDLSSGFEQVSAGREHSLALKSDGSIVAWGSNEYGRIDLPSPNTGFAAVSAGYQHSIALKQDGTILAWGANFQGQCNLPSPNSNFVTIDAGWFHNLAIKSDGSIVGWGHNYWGEATAPVPNTGFVAVAAGRRHSLALKSDGSIVAWGNNDHGQCNLPSPNSGFVAIASGCCHSLGLKSNGSVVAWGAGQAGQSGWPHYGQSIVPSPNTGFVAISAGELFSMGLKSDGSIVTWGRNEYGQGTVPSPNSGFVAMSGSFHHGLGLKSDGSVVAWGRNSRGQSSVPPPNLGFVSVSGGSSHTLARRSSGVIESWGTNANHQCDVPSPNSGFLEVSGGGHHSLGLRSNGVIEAWGWNNDGQCNVPSPNSDFIAASAGGSHSLGLKSNGSVLGWGWNTYGQCDVPSPNSGFVAISAGCCHSLGLKSNGSIVGWGRNNYGQTNAPFQNSGLVAISAGRHHNLALKSDGSIFAWGDNSYGQCNVPQPNSGFIAVAAGRDHSLGLRSNGKIEAWGLNSMGQCDVPEPNIGFVAIGAGGHHSLAVREPVPPECMRYITMTSEPSEAYTDEASLVTTNVVDGNYQSVENQRVDVSVEGGTLISIYPNGALIDSMSGYAYTNTDGNVYAEVSRNSPGSIRVTSTLEACEIEFDSSTNVTVHPIPGDISIEDSIPPTDDRDMPFGELLQGYSRTEQLTIRNTNPEHNLIVNQVFLKGAPSGNISGNVKDSGGVNLSSVTVSTMVGGYSTTSDPLGNYTLYNVAVGTYDVVASKTAYGSQIHTNLTVYYDETTTVNFTLTELMYDGMPGGTNMALEATQWPTDSNFSSAYDGSKAKDGIVSGESKWCSNNLSSTHWLAYDLGAYRTVNGFVVRHAGAAGEPTSYNTKHFRFQSGPSINGPWTDESIVDNSAQANVTARTYHMPKSLRYVRLYITNCGIDNYARIPEFEVWCAQNPGSNPDTAHTSDISNNSTTGGKGNPPGPPEAYHPDTLLVGFDPGVVTSARASIHSALGVTKVHSYSRIPVDVVRIPKGGNIQSYIAAYRNRPGIAYVEPNYEVRALTVPNDPRFGEQWGLHNTGQTGGTPGADIGAVEAWEITTGSNDVIVAVVDTGIDYNHPDLAANMWVNSNPTFGDVHGARWTNGDGTVTSGNPMDDNGHGTHCAGIIGAVGNNGVGVSGISWNASLMALKFLRSDGTGYTADAVAAIQYAIDYGAHISSHSWGGTVYSQSLKNIIDAAGVADQLVIAAAGNDGTNNDITPHYPSSYDCTNIIAVASSDHNDQRSIFSSGSSNWGPTSVHLAAPGSDILSTYRNSAYGQGSGTSMATPFVSGTAALIRGLNLDASRHDVKNWILQSVDQLPAWDGLTITGGRLNAAAALRLGHPHFRLEGMPSLPFSIPPGGSLAVDVVYAPIWEGDHANILRIESNDEDEPAAEVTLSGSCIGVTVSATIGMAKVSSDGVLAAIDGSIVSAAWNDVFYISADDRSSGMRVQSADHGLLEGMRANIVGQIRTNSDGERYLAAYEAQFAGIGTIAPLGMTNRLLGGDDLLDPITGIGQMGVTGGSGTNNIGLLITAWGEVTHVGAGYLYIDDGSGLNDGTGNIGVQVICNPANYETGDFLTVNGISSCFDTGDGLARRILTRDPSDIVKR